MKIQKHDYLINYKEITECFLHLVYEAKDTIYLAAWVIDFNYPIKENLTFLDLLSHVSNKGVKIYILLYENVLYPYMPPPRLPKNCHIKTIGNSGECLRGIAANFFKFFVIKNKYYNFNNRLFSFHQKYLLIDEKKIMLGGTDIEAQRFEGIQNNTLTQWRELAVSLVADKEIVNFIKKNYQTGGRADLISKKWVGSFDTFSTEQARLIALVKTAKHSLYIENQYFFSIRGGSHKVIDALIEKIHSMMIQQKPFKVIVITNTFPYDSRNKVIQFIYKSRLAETLLRIYHYFERKGFSLNEIEKYFICGEISSEKLHCFTHAKLFIQDEKNYLVSSSNISDRSLAHGKSDKELGVVLNEAEEGLIFNKIIESFLFHKQKLSVYEFYDLIVTNKTHIKLIKFNAIKSIRQKMYSIFLYVGGILFMSKNFPEL